MLNNFLRKHIDINQFLLKFDILPKLINHYYCFVVSYGLFFKSYLNRKIEHIKALILMVNIIFTPNIFKILFLFLCFNFVLIPSNLYAQISSAYNGVRNTSQQSCNDKVIDQDEDKGEYNPPCYTSSYDDNTYKCNVGSIDSNIFTGIDIDWNMSNESCLAYCLTTGIALQAIFTAARSACADPPAIKSIFDRLQDGKKVTRLKNTAKLATSGSTPLVAMMIGMPIDAGMALELGWWGYKCAGGLYSCCAPALGAAASYGAAIGAIFAIWDIANKTFASTTVCGDGYKIFFKNSDNVYVQKNSEYVQCLNKIFRNDTETIVNLSASKYTSLSTSLTPFLRLSNLMSNHGIDSTCSNGASIASTISNLTNLHYREYFYTGIEYEDNGGGACDNPNWGKDESEGLLGYHLGKQRYYFRGSAQKPNFACERFLVKGFKDEEGFKAYNCCIKRSQNTTCLETKLSSSRAPTSSTSSSGYTRASSFSGSSSSSSSSSSTSSSNYSNYFDYKFCSSDRDCIFNNQDGYGIKYDIFESSVDSNYLCAKTYSLCPFDHNMGGGTDLAEYYINRPSIITNFCQYMRHCIKKPFISKPNYFDPDTFFLAESCGDMVGDSQLVFKVSNLKFSPIDSRNLSAPIVQCLKESLENNFFQKAGQTKCNLAVEKYNPSKNKCVNLSSQDESEPLYRKGDKLGDTIFSKIQKNFRYPIKIALVLSVVMFGYQILMATPEVFLNKKTIMTYLVKFGLVSFFVLGNAWQGFFVDSIMRISTDLSDITFRPMATLRSDGCVFPKYNHTKLKQARESGYKSNLLQTDNSSPASYPEGKNYLRIFDTLDCKISRAIGYGPEVSVSNLFKMIFAGFISGPLGIMIFMAGFAYAFLLFSIVIRAVQILIMSILAIILLIYISPITITCALFERTKSIFENWWKQLLGFILQPMILFAYLGLLFTVFDNAFIGDARFSAAANSNFNYPSLDCSDYQIGGTLIKPSETSLYCIVNFPSFKSYTGLEVFDLALPVLTGLNKTKINTVLKSAILMFVFFHFLDKITTVAKKLVGGAELKADFDPNISKQIQSVMKGVQKRALNSTARLATKQIPRGAAAIARSFSSKEASAKADDVKKDEDKEGGDSTGQAADGGGDSGSAGSQDSSGSQSTGENKSGEGDDSGKTGSV